MTASLVVATVVGNRKIACDSLRQHNITKTVKISSSPWGVKFTKLLCYVHHPAGCRSLWLRSWLCLSEDMIDR